MATAETKLSLKLLIDTKAKKLLFAEVDKDFVDFLFHILSLPVGTVTRLLKEKGMNGCLHNIYQSVENLNDSHIQWKDSILQPKCPFRISSVPLLLNDAPSMAIYQCPRFPPHDSYVTDDSSARCPDPDCDLQMSGTCNLQMSDTMTYVAPPGKVATGGFVKDMVKYMVMDDLVVKPGSVVSSITSLTEYFNIKDFDALHEEVVHFGKEEALKLLKLSFESKAVLTSLFMMSSVKAEK
ncbi:uncharacterized protein LOC132046011 [Lycium ferocissimum]|uniref:uncharacterized protein LOC132046011 n=1 Tax=Lycium ferocissimum TaxID=112874 RepID=UPI002815551F|nr:uncharacterized protein LOC132046011 [Lycium ferocissimum]